VLFRLAGEPLDVLLESRVDEVDELSPVGGAVEVERGPKLLGRLQVRDEDLISVTH